MAELDGELLDHRADQRHRVHEAGVAIALHDLGRSRLEADAEPRAHGLLHGGIEVREGADGARDLADRGLVDRAREPLAVAAQRLVQHQQLQAEGRRLGVDAVRAADAGRVRCSRARAAQRGERAIAAGEQQVARGADLQRERGVEHVARRHPVVDEARVGTDVLGDAGEERDHVVLHLALDLGDARGVEAGARADRCERRGGNHAAFGEHFADGELDAQPEAVARLVGPERPHLGPAVALDHRKPARR